MNTTGPDLEVCLVTADGAKKLVYLKNVYLQVGPVDSVTKFYPIYDALLVEKLPDITNCFPNSENLIFF